MRSWPGLAAVGAGLIHLGVAAGSPVALLVPLVLVGAGEAAWGVLALARPDPPRLRASLGVAAGLVGLLVLVLVVAGSLGHHGGAALHLGGLAGAGTLDLAVAVLLAVRLRRGSRGTEPGAARYLLGTALGVAVVTLVATASLAGTPAAAPHVH